VKLEAMRMTVLIAPVSAEQAAEHEDFGRQEHPHRQLARIVLLLHRLEVMREVRMMGVPVGLFKGGSARLGLAHVLNA
jgi:hypothetical protein